MFSLRDGLEVMRGARHRRRGRARRRRRRALGAVARSCRPTSRPRRSAARPSTRGRPTARRCSGASPPASSPTWRRRRPRVGCATRSPSPTRPGPAATTSCTRSTPRCTRPCATRCTRSPTTPRRVSGPSRGGPPGRRPPRGAGRETAPVMRLLSVNVGRPREVDWRGRTVRTSIWKSAVADRRWVGRLNVARRRAGRPRRARRRAPRGLRLRRLRLPPLGARARPRRLRPRPVRRELHRRGPARRRGVRRGPLPDRRRAGRGHPAPGDVPQGRHPAGGAADAGAALRARPARLLPARARGGRGRRRRRDRARGGRARGDDRARGQRAALPARPDRRALERALAIPALPEGWRHSFRALLEQLEEGASGNRGLAPPSGGPPAWTGLRPFRIAAVTPRDAVDRLVRARAGRRPPLPPFRPGQFLTVRVRPAGAPRALLRSFSLSAAPDARRYRLSVKREPGGAVSAHLHDHAAPGDVLEVGAPRGTFTLDPRATGPVALLSAGVGATPVLAMLASLAAAGDEREVWWIHGARNRAEHAFADEVRRHLAALPGARSHIRFSRPAATDVPGRDYDARGPRDRRGAWRTSASRSPRTGTSAARRRGCATSAPALLAAASRRSGCTPRSSARSRWPGPSARPTRRRARRASARRSPSPPRA